MRMVMPAVSRRVGVNWCLNGMIAVSMQVHTRVGLRHMLIKLIYAGVTHFDRIIRPRWAFKNANGSKTLEWNQS